MKKKTMISLLLTIIIVFSSIQSVMAATGSWKINTKAPSYVTSQEKAIFKKAVKGLAGAEYTPVFKMASQTVSGTNYAFFCKAKMITAKPVPSWKVVIVNKDLKGNAKVLKVNSFSYKKVATRDSQYKQASGTGVWKYNKKAYKSKVLPKKALTAFNKAKKNYDGVSLTPLVLLGSQVVAGTNYRYLCRGKVVAPKSTSCLYVVDVYQDTKGSAKITECKILDIDKYLKY